jgi:hypothetical protein
VAGERDYSPVIERFRARGVELERFGKLDIRFLALLALHVSYSQTETDVDVVGRPIESLLQGIARRGVRVRASVRPACRVAWVTREAALGSEGSTRSRKETKLSPARAQFWMASYA